MPEREMHLRRDAPAAKRSGWVSEANCEAAARPRAVRSPDERSEELCEAKSQEGAREPRRVSTDRRSLPKAVSRVVPQGAERKHFFPTLYTLYMFYTARITKARGVSAAGFILLFYAFENCSG